MREFLYMVGAFTGIMAIVLVPIVVVEEIYCRYTCSNYEKITGKETKYLTLDTCYVKTDAGWQSWDEYKNRAIASEGLNN